MKRFLSIDRCSFSSTQADSSCSMPIFPGYSLHVGEGQGRKGRRHRQNFLIILHRLFCFRLCSRHIVILDSQDRFVHTEVQISISSMMVTGASQKSSRSQDCLDCMVIGCEKSRNDERSWRNLAFLPVLISEREALDQTRSHLFLLRDLGLKSRVGVRTFQFV
jgi:hypothetical protein